MRYAGNSCSRFTFIGLTFCYLINSFALLFLGLWMLFDPMKSYFLNLVDFSENDPLLKFATYGMLAISAFTFFAGFVGLLAAFKSEQCLLTSFALFSLLTFFAKWTIASMAFTYKENFPGTSMTVYLANISQNRYHRDHWVRPMMDSVQFYQQCCGGNGPLDYHNSFWYLTNTERGTRSFVPQSCCKQSQNGRAWALQPIDPMCTTYHYNTKAFNDSVHIKGCGRTTKDWLASQVILFIAITLGTSIIDFLLVLPSFIYANCSTTALSETICNRPLLEESNFDQPHEYHKLTTLLPNNLKNEYVLPFNHDNFLINPETTSPKSLL